MADNTIMTDEEVQESFQRLLNHNGGWAVIGSHCPYQIGEIGEHCGFRFVVVAESTREEAEADAAFLGAKIEQHLPYLYRIMVDCGLMKYRVFVEDVGPGKFSGVKDVEAPTPRRAIHAATKVDGFTGDPEFMTWCGKRLIAIPHSRKDLWPDGKTGRVPREALNFK